jgi:sporulation protein YlmC with PRC-barrel domain
MDLVHDLLDKQVVDRNGRELGRVDSIVLHVRDDGPPTVAAIEIGAAVLAHRILPILGRWAAALEHAFGVEQGRPVRISVGRVLNVTNHVTVDLTFAETPASAVERLLRRWVGALPGSS